MVTSPHLSVKVRCEEFNTAPPDRLPAWSETEKIIKSRRYTPIAISFNENVQEWKDIKDDGKGER